MQSLRDGIEAMAVESQLSLPSLLRMRWAEFERQLYEGAVSDASRYKELLTNVRALANSLHHINALEELASAWSQAVRTGLHMSSSSENPLHVDEKTLGAAFSLRAREIQQLEVSRSIRQRLDHARESESMWVMLDEAGDLDAGIRAPYRSTEMHLASGWAIFSMVQPDPLHGAPIFVASIVKVDPATGEMLDATPGLDDWNENKTREEFLASRQAMRGRIEALPG